MNGLVVAVMASFAVAIGYVTGSPVPTGIAGALVCAHVFGLVSSRRVPSRFLVDREADKQMVEAGGSILARVRIRSSAAVPMRWVLVKDHVPGGVQVDAPTGRLSFGASSQSEGFFYRASFSRRGIYELGPAELSSGDLLATRADRQTDAQATKIVVHPRVIPMAPARLPSNRPFGDLRADPKSHEDPTRPSGCRPYAYGDPLKRIHWAATARTGALISRLYDGSSSPVTAVVVNQCEGDYASEDELELACCAAASILSALLRDGAEASLVGHGLRSATGDLHLERCLAALATLQTSRESFADQLIRLRHEMPWRPTLVVVSPSLDERGGAALEILRTAGATVALVAVGADEKRSQKAMGITAALGGSVMRISEEDKLASARFIGADNR